jgi:hypothetical protein
MRRAILAAAVLVGCAPKLRDTEDEPISAAWLEYFDLSSLAVIGGAVDGDAFLGYTTLDGDSRSMPVHLGGPVVGLVVDMSVDPEWGSSVPLDLGDAEVDPVMLSDVLGTYHGPGASFVMGFGVDTRELVNRHGIRFQEDHLAFGVGIMAGFQWVRIREGGSETGENEDPLFGDDTDAPPDDTEAPPDDSGGGDDTAVADDSGTSDDSGASDDSGKTADDSASGDDTGGGGQATPPPRKKERDGCGKNDSGGGDGSTDDESSSSGDDGCCCGATNSAFIVGVWLLLGGRRRRRRV